ncbi:T9SS type A sorting domain-containing protein [Flavobacterium terrisoli]|uniref:T9SS type A sorting domain-containing protein n=1 Tax=Flavobacterium terrisoli TaxID=3242195 RepID=UPI002542AA81|nr:T9SS type A sorting domain-containing protein [Flavobacterium buctense]
MKKTTIILITLLINSVYTNAQPTLQWQKALGGTGEESANSIIQTADGGYIVAGNTLSTDGNVTGNHGGEDYWVVKLSSTGTIQWQKTLGGSNDDIAKGIVQTADGGYVVAGYSGSNDGDVTGNHGEYDYWIVKLNSTGVIQWQKSLGGIENDIANGVTQTADGGLLICGITYSYDGDITLNNGYGDCWIVKLNSAGVLQWQKSIGGTDSDEGMSIKQTADGGIIVAATTFSNDFDVSGNHGEWDFWVAKLNATGTIQWQNTLGGTLEDEAATVIQTNDGGYAVVGTVLTTTPNTGNIVGAHGDNDYWVVKLNSAGVLQWQKPLGGTSYDYGFGVVETIDGGLVVAGSSQSTNGNSDLSNDMNGNYWLVKLNSAGAIQWQKNYGGTEFDRAHCIIKTADNGLAVAGFAFSNNEDVSGNHGESDYWIVKLSADPLGTADFNNNEIKLYPNPVSDVLQIQEMNEPITAIKIIDLTGKTVLQQSTNTQMVNVEMLSNGMYVLEVYSAMGKCAYKFVKQ